MNYGLDTGMYPLGSCTMKYNPKVAETVAALPGFQRLHPLQPDSTAQGALELLWRLERALCEITGMARATLQPPAGACGEMTGLLLMRAFHEDRGDQRRRVIIPDSAHGTNPASVRLAGFEAVPVRSDARGLVDVGRPRQAGGRVGRRSDADEPQYARALRGGDRRDRGDDPRCGRPPVLRRSEPQRDPRPLSSGGHGVRHRAHQHAQDLRDPARRRRSGGGTRRGE